MVYWLPGIHNHSGVTIVKFRLATTTGLRRNSWTEIEVNSLEELMDIQKQYNGLDMAICSCYGEVPVIEIIDDYRE